MSRDTINNEGGPAFPVSIPGVGDNGWQGMTLRDWFAGQAMSSLTSRWGKATIPESNEIARFSYAMADAMLKARQF